MKTLRMFIVGALFMVTAGAIVLLSTPVAFADWYECESECWFNHQSGVNYCVNTYYPGTSQNNCFADNWDETNGCWEICEDIWGV